MRTVLSALAALAGALVVNRPARATEAAATPTPCSTTYEFLARDCPVTWHDIDRYGADPASATPKTTALRQRSAGASPSDR